MAYPEKIMLDLKEMHFMYKDNKKMKKNLISYTKRMNLTNENMICSLYVIINTFEKDTSLWQQNYIVDREFRIWLRLLALLGDEKAIDTYKKLLINKEAYDTQDIIVRLLFDIGIPWYPLSELIVNDTYNIKDGNRISLYDEYLRSHVINKINDHSVKDSVITLLCYALKIDLKPYSIICIDSLLSDLSPVEYKFSKERRIIYNKLEKNPKMVKLEKDNIGEYNFILLKIKDVLSIPEFKLYSSERFRECLGL
jgi:hypothetical protein